MVPNRGQVLTLDQLEGIVRRLFNTLDMSCKNALDKEECEEFFDFVAENLYHKTHFVNKKELVTFEERWEQLSKVEDTKMVPNTV